MESYDQEFARKPQYVAEPAFVQNSPSEVQSPLVSASVGGKFKPYCPGEMLAESAFITSGFGVSAQIPAEEAVSDCSTTDTMNEAMSMQMTASDGSMNASAAAFMMPDMAMQSPWPPYAAAAPEYWMPYPPVAPQSTWSPMQNAGSTGHRLGKCKPCAFMYKDGCLSGSACPYCHLCPPGEKQRRKRVMRAMQRNMGPQ